MDSKVTVHLRFDNGALVPCEHASAFALKFTSGTEPYGFNVHVSDLSTLPPVVSGQNGQKVAFIISTPDTKGGRVEYTSYGWYIVRVEAGRTEQGVYMLSIADERWLLGHKRFAMSYNVQWPDGSYRSETTPRGGKYGGWTAKEALNDALTKMGYTPNFDKLSLRKNGIDLPNNLGNSRGGGWVSADWSEIVDPMLEVLDANIYFINGQPRITDRSGQEGIVTELRTMARIADTVDPGERKWEMPRFLDVQFEIKAESVIESFYGSATTTKRAFFDVPENVMPRLEPEARDPELWWDAQVGEQQKTEWVEIEDEVSSKLSDWTAAEVPVRIGENWFLPFVIPFKRSGQWGEITEDADAATNAEIIQKKLWFDSQIRRHFHRTYRVTYPLANTPEAPNYRSMSGIRMGRLTPGGDTISRGAVWMDWCEETSAAVRSKDIPTGGSKNPLADAKFGVNHLYDPTRPAPFVAEFVAESGNELIFQISPVEAGRLGQEKILPGYFTELPNYGEWFGMVVDDYIPVTELQAKLEWDLSFRVCLSGRVIDDPEAMMGATTQLGEFKGRVLNVRIPLFSDGGVESIAIKDNAMTANYGYSKAQLAISSSIAEQWPEVLLNLSQLQSRASAIKESVEARYREGNAGGLLFPGVEPATRGIYPGGDVWEMAIVIGDPDAWAVTTQYHVLPGMPGSLLTSEERNGQPPEVIAAE